MFEPVDASYIKDIVKKVLSSEEYLDQESISLFSVEEVYREIRKDLEETKQTVEDRINNKIKAIDEGYYVKMKEFDYEKNEVAMAVYKSPKPKETIFFFSKKEYHFELSRIEGAQKSGLDDILKLIATELYAWDDYCNELRKFATCQAFGVKSSNTDFIVNLSATCTRVYLDRSSVTSSFKMLTFYEEKKWYISCSVKDVKELLKNNELQFVKNIFVRIEDCPEWMQTQLVVERLDQLEVIEEEKERQAKLTKKQKRREFWRKVFPFIR